MARPRTAEFALDLGTCRTRLINNSGEMIADAPTIVALPIGRRGNGAVAIGAAAQRMEGRVPIGLEVVRPVRNGAISSFSATEVFLRALLRQSIGRSLRKPIIAVCVHQSLSAIQRRALLESVLAAGAREVHLLPSPVATALGAGLAIPAPEGNIVANLGAGGVEVAITSLGGVANQRRSPHGGDLLEDGIHGWLRVERGVQIGSRTVRNLKHHVCAASPNIPRSSIRVRARSLADGSPTELDVSTHDLHPVVAPVVRSTIQVVLETLRSTSPELSADIFDRGLLLCGGGSRLRGLAEVLRHTTTLPVLQTENPEHCTILGAGQLLADPEQYELLVHR